MSQNNEVDYGPLTHFIGVWQGTSGIDISPEPDGVEENRYREQTVYTPIGYTTNAEQQNLASIHYHQVIHRENKNQKMIHNQTGYWLWDAENNTIIHSFTIPRGLTVLAGGQYRPASTNTIQLSVTAAASGSFWNISQSQFLQENGKTLRFEQDVELTETTLQYNQETHLEIYGRAFIHTEKMTLSKHQ